MIPLSLIDVAPEPSGGAVVLILLVVVALILVVFTATAFVLAFYLSRRKKKAREFAVAGISSQMNTAAGPQTESHPL